MSRNYYSEIHLHIVWHTKESAPLLASGNRTVRASVFAATPHQHAGHFRPRDRRDRDTRASGDHDCADRAHQRVDRAIERGVEPRDQPTVRPRKVLEWQAGYGVVSFGTQALDWVRAIFAIKRSITAEGQSMIGWNGSRPRMAGRQLRQWLKPIHREAR